MDLKLDGKTAIISGGASNIGFWITMALAREGSNVVIADIDRSQAKRVAELARDQFGVKGLGVETGRHRPGAVPGRRRSHAS